MMKLAREALDLGIFVSDIDSEPRILPRNLRYGKIGGYGGAFWGVASVKVWQ